MQNPPAKPIADYTDFVFIIGSKTDITNLNIARIEARNVVLACNANRRATISFIIHGYDDDPRELFDIPEVQNYCTVFFGQLIELSSIDLLHSIASRLTPESLRCAALVIP